MRRISDLSFCSQLNFGVIMVMRLRSSSMWCVGEAVCLCSVGVVNTRIDVAGYAFIYDHGADSM